MISYVKGELSSVEEDRIVVDVDGVGFEIFMPETAMGNLPQTGNQVKIYTYLNVREDAMQLFGFFTKDDLEVFKLLIGVSGIGPKGGLGILSRLSADDLRYAILSGDSKAISDAPGIGKKTAEKVILELKDKLNAEEFLTHTQGEGNTSSGSVLSGSNEAQNEAIQALVALGYNSTDSMRAVKAVAQEDDTVEDLLKAALKILF